MRIPERYSEEIVVVIVGIGISCWSISRNFWVGNVEGLPCFFVFAAGFMSCFSCMLIMQSIHHSAKLGCAEKQ